MAGKPLQNTYSKYPSLIQVAGFNLIAYMEGYIQKEEIFPIGQLVYLQEKLHPRMLEINYKEFEKTQIDKDLLKLTKKEHRKAVIKAGKNPRKHMNVTSYT